MWLLLILTLGGSPMTPLEQMVARNVVVETEESRCSGVILETGIVLTVFHALDTDSGIMVNGKEAKVVLIRQDIDLIVLRVPTDKVPDITFGTGIGVTKQVVQVGNPARFTGVVSIGRVILTDEKYLFTDTLAIPGLSGSGLYSVEGHLVGLVQKMFGAKSGSWITRALRAEEIIKALEGG